MIWQLLKKKFLGDNNRKNCFHIYDEEKEDGLDFRHGLNFDFVEKIKFFIQLAYEILMDIIPECTNQDVILRDILTCVIRRARAQMPTCKSHTIKF